MKYVNVPNPITLKNPQSGQDGQQFTLRDYAYNFWLDDPRWQKPVSNLVRLAKVIPEFEKSVGETMKFEDADWTVLVDIVRNPHVDPQTGNVMIARPLIQLQLESFRELILNAKSELPLIALQGEANGTSSVSATAT